MRGSEPLERLQGRLQRDTEYMRKAREDGQRPSALMFYGRISGTADAMSVCGLISAEEAEEIRRKAWDIYVGKDVKP